MLNRNGILDLLLCFSLIAFSKTPFQQDKTAMFGVRMSESLSATPFCISDYGTCIVVPVGVGVEFMRIRCCCV